MKTNNKIGVFAALRMAARAHYLLTIGTLPADYWHTFMRGLVSYRLAAAAAAACTHH